MDRFSLCVCMRSEQRQLSLTSRNVFSLGLITSHCLLVLIWYFSALFPNSKWAVNIFALTNSCMLPPWSLGMSCRALINLSRLFPVLLHGPAVSQPFYFFTWHNHHFFSTSPRFPVSSVDWCLCLLVLPDLEVGVKPSCSASSLPSLLKNEQATFSSTENLDSTSSTPYPSSPALSSAKVFSSLFAKPLLSTSCNSALHVCWSLDFFTCWAGHQLFF